MILGELDNKRNFHLSLLVIQYHLVSEFTLRVPLQSNFHIYNLMELRIKEFHHGSLVRLLLISRKPIIHYSNMMTVDKS
jgi:hypothetical protein